MNRQSELESEIMDLYYDGMRPATIAATLQISVKLVIDVIAQTTDLEKGK